MNHGRRHPRRGAFAGIAALALCALGGCTTGSTFSFYEENDVFALSRPDDRHYTQGGRLSWLYPTADAPALARGVAHALPVPEATTEAIGLVIGQEIYTPEDISEPRFIPGDRPYGGWLYGGIVVANVDWAEDGPRGDDMDSYEFDLGLIGARSYAREAQTETHRIIDSPKPRGWDHQLDEEIGLVFRYEHRARVLTFGDTGLGGDVLAGLGGSLGNVFTQAQVSAVARLGHRVPRDFGVSTIHRAAAEVAPAQDHGGFRMYLFAGVEGRAVGRNVFLDGNTFRDSHSVDRDTWVGEALAGIAISYENLRLTLSQVRRSSEFREQPGGQEFGSLGLQWVWGFPDQAPRDPQPGPLR